MGTLILDTSVVIGLLDTADQNHARAVDDVEAADRAGQRLLLPATAYTEALTAFALAGRTDEASEAIKAMGISVAELTEGIGRRAGALRRRHKRLRPAEAIALATAQEHDGTLLSYDDRLNKLASDPPT